MDKDDKMQSAATDLPGDAPHAANNVDVNAEQKIKNLDKELDQKSQDSKIDVEEIIKAKVRSI